MTEPEFVATPQGAEEVIRRGNRRRRLRGGASALAVAFAAAGVFMIGAGGGASQSDSLIPAVDPTPTFTPPATPSPGTTTPPPPAAAPTPVGSPTGSPRASASPSPQEPAPRSTASATPATRRSSPITRGSASMAGDDLCAEDQTDAAQGWCLRYTGPATARRGHPVALSMRLCRLGSFPAGSVRFANTREAHLGIGGADWQAGQGETYTSPGRTVSVQPGSCLTWTSTWDTRGSDGFLVLPGSYSVSVAVESDLSLGTSFYDLEVTD